MSHHARPLQVSHWTVFAAYFLLAILMTLPLAFRLGNSLLATDSAALNDTYFLIWNLGWQTHQLFTDPLDLFHGNIFHPLESTVAFSDIILPATLLYAPFAFASGNPVLAHNVVVLLSFPLNALAMYSYALDWLGTTGEGRGQPRERLAAAFLAGFIFAFCTYKMGELRHVQLLMAMFMPLTLLYLGRFTRTPNLGNAIRTALCFALNALASVYYGVFLAFAVALYAVVEIVGEGFRPSRKHLVYGVAAFVLATALMLPFILPYVRIEREYQFSSSRDPRLFSARPASYLATPASQWLYGDLTRAFYVACKGQPLFPGVATLVLSFVGIVALFREGNRAWMFPSSLALMGFVLSFGPVLVLGRATTPALSVPLPYELLSWVVWPLKSMTAPARFAVLTMLALSLLAARGFFALLGSGRRWSRVAALVGAVLIPLEFIAVPLRSTHVDAGANVSPAYRFLAEQPRGEAVVEVPMGEPTYGGQNRYAVYTYNSLYHLLPLINGYSGLIPPQYYALVAEMKKFPSAAAVERLDERGARWIVVHADGYKNPAELRQRLAGLERIEHVRDYGPVWLYRIRTE